MCAAEMAQTPIRQIPASYSTIATIQNEDRRVWTVARCNRLLRPLATSLKRLRDHLSKHNALVPDRAKAKTEDISDEKRCQREERPKKTKKRKLSGSNSGGSEYEEDDSRDSDWEWPALKKRPRHRYRVSRKYSRQCEGNRLSDKETCASSRGKPGEIILPTPMFKRAMSQIVPFEVVQDPQSPIAVQTKSPCTAKKTKSRWSGFKSAGENSAADEVYKALSNILEATIQERSGLRPKGTKSLLALCIQKVPNYIEVETYWRKLDDPTDDSNVAEEVFTELENLGASDTSGWKHLRLLVRSQSIAALQDLIADLGSHCTIVKHLLDVCYEHKAYDEAAQLLSAFASASAPFPAPQNDGRSNDRSETMPLFSMLGRHSRKVGSSSFHTRLIAHLISSGSLPLRWITTDGFQNLYLVATSNNMLPERENDGSGTALLSSTMTAACGLLDLATSSKHEGLSNHHGHLGSAGTIACVRSICNNIICAAILADGSKGEFERITHPIRLACSQLMASYRIDDPELDIPQGSSIFHKIIIISNLLLCLLGTQSAGGSSRSACQYLELLTVQLGPNDGKTPKSAETDDLVQFFDHLMRCYNGLCKILPSSEIASTFQGQVRIGDAFHLFREIIHRLLDFAKENQTRLSSNTVLFAQRLALDSTMHFASAFETLNYETLCSETETSVLNFGTEGMLNVSRTSKLERDLFSPVKWRWDDGICEFIAKTPRPQKSQSQEVTPETESSCDSSVTDKGITPAKRISPRQVGSIAKPLHVPSVVIGHSRSLPAMGALLRKGSEKKKDGAVSRGLVKAARKSDPSLCTRRRSFFRSARLEDRIHFFETDSDEDEGYNLPPIKQSSRQPLQNTTGANKACALRSADSGKGREQIDVEMLGSDLTSDELA